jgi:DNA polymerase-1
MIEPLFIPVDVETTMNATEALGLAHPMHPDNKVVLFGTILPLGRIIIVKPGTVEYGDLTRTLFKETFLPKTILCGCNMSFDMQYLIKTDFDYKSLFDTTAIWDVQLAEYLLTAQRAKFSSLDELAVKYGFSIKDTRLKDEYFSKGIGCDKIPLSILGPYLINDLMVTQGVAERQWDIASKNGMLPLIQSQMAALKATSMMTYHGLYVDGYVLNAYTDEIVKQFTVLQSEIKYMCPEVDELNSSQQWSKYFFGGTKKVTKNEQVGMYKNGKPKYKNVTVEVPIEAKINIHLVPPGKVGKSGFVSVDEDVLNTLSVVPELLGTELKGLIDKLIEYRGLSKQLTTYVLGLSKHLIGDYIHGKLNHTVTTTGRLSSSSPNLQNISNSEIKKIFVSRFKNGKLVEVDFSQLEVVVLAHLSKDPQLIKDLVEGVDIHSALYKAMYGKTPTKEERKPFKSRTFQLIYGAGAKAIAASAKCTLGEAKDFINVFYERYPEVAKWKKNFADSVVAAGKHLVDDTKTGLLPYAECSITVKETNRRLYFKEYKNDSEYARKDYSYSPTELSNYPVQSLATGDIVLFMVGIVYDWIKTSEDVLFINTIHDSLLFDVKEEAHDEFVFMIKEMLCNTHKFFKEVFKHELALPLNANVSSGSNWLDMVEIEV